jgi:hypothetical protein
MLAGLDYLVKPMPSEAVAAWGALSSLTSLEVDTLSNLAPALTQLPNLVELSVTASIIYLPILVVYAMPRLQVLRLPVCSRDYTFTKHDLDVFRSMQQLQRVDNIRVGSADLSHPFVMSKCYPSVQVVISSVDRARDIAEWVQRGGEQQVTNLLIRYVMCTFETTKPSISEWSGFNALRSLELYQLDLSSGFQQLRGLTQLTHLKMNNCSPSIRSLDQLPPGLCSLSLDNLIWSAALHEEQQQQQLSSTSTPQLPHLTRLVCTEDATVYAACRVITSLTNLQELVLDSTFFSLGATHEPLSQLTSISSLTIPSLGASSSRLEAISALAKFPGLQQLEVATFSVVPEDGLQIAATLGYLTAIKLKLGSAWDWHGHVVSGGPLQVRVLALVARKMDQAAASSLI